MACYHEAVLTLLKRNIRLAAVRVHLAAYGIAAPPLVWEDICSRCSVSVIIMAINTDTFGLANIFF